MPSSNPYQDSDPSYHDVDYNIEMNKIRYRVNCLEKQNMKLMEHIAFLKKNGYTYDQLTTRMLLCDRCHKNLILEPEESK